VVPFGTSRLVVVASPRTALAGTLAVDLPWVVALVGLAMTVVVAILVERLVRRESHAEALAGQNELLYRRQRDVALTLQRALLPPRFPEVEGFEFAASYLPGMAGTEIGGDWYSA